jgi:Domain of unknown function (DUF4326)
MSRTVFVVSVRKLKPEARPGVVYVGRACGPWPQSPWHNPFKVKPGASSHTKRVAVEKFMSMILARPTATLLADLQALYDETEKGSRPLACWCCSWSASTNPNACCHAVELAKLMNAYILTGAIQ